jgi:Uncharacterised nucleotidyltransferase
MAKRARTAQRPAALALLIDLIAATRSGCAPGRLTPIDRDIAPTVVAVARAHAVEAWLAACVPSNDPAWADAAAQRPRFLAAAARTRGVISELSAFFAARDVQWAVLKGLALAHTVYPRPDLRTSVDLDLLVPPARFAGVVADLEDVGYELLERNWPLMAALRPGQCRLRSPRGILIDLHWSVVNDASLRDVFPWPTSALLSRRVMLPIGMPALDPVDQLVHLGLHGALSGGNRLSWLLDADLAARKVANWGPVVDVVYATQSGSLLALILRRARRLWCTPVPREVMDQLARRRCLSLPAAAAHLGRLADDPERPALYRATARSLRPTDAATLRELTRHGVEWLRAGRPRLRMTSVNRPDNPSSMLFDADDPASRAAYFRAVGAGE